MFHVETCEGDRVSALDYGEMFLKSDLSASKILCLCNTSDEVVNVQVRDASNEEYRLTIKLLELGDEIEDSEMHFFHMISEMPQDSFCLPPQSKTKVLFLLCSSSLSHDTTLQRKARTSFFRVSPVLKFICTTKGYVSSEVMFPVHISLCLSLLSVDEKDVDFDACHVGNTYIRDVQIWNRSEGVLQYKIVPSKYDEYRLLNSSSLRVSDLETGKNVIGGDRVLTIPAFSSQRVRIAFSATHIEDSILHFYVSNCNNSSNTVSITCRLTVCAQDNTDADGLIVETDSGAAVGVDGRVFDFGDCYNDLETVRKLWLRNTTIDTIEIRISTDCPKEIVVDTVSDQATSKESSASMGKAIQFGATFGKVGGKSKSKSQSIPNPTWQFLEDGGASSAQKQKQLLQRNSGNEGGGKLMAGGDQEVPLRVSYPADTSEDGVISFSSSSVMATAKKKMQGKYQSHELQSSSSYQLADSFAGDFDSDDYCPGSELRFRRFFTPSTKNGCAGVFSAMMKSPENGRSDVVRRNRLRQQQGSRSRSHTNDSANCDSKIGIRSRETDVIVLPPGARKPFYLKFSPIIQRKAAALVDHVYGATTNVLRDRPQVAAREGKERLALSNRDRDRDREDKKLVSSAGNQKVFPHARRSEGVLERRTMKLMFVYKTAARNTKSDRHHSEHVKLKQKVFSKQVTCRAKTCTSIITCTPKVLDLGECNVGDYRNVVFTIKNESDLPALVLPYMESQSLGLVEKELQIAPRQSKQCKFEYIARNIENDYHKNILLINVFNSHCNLGVQVKAKISDAHQVLRHSLFYKIYTRDNRKQLQVYFSKCLYNMPNLKTFVFRNIYSKALRVELTVDDPVDLGIYLYKPSEGYGDKTSDLFTDFIRGVRRQESSATKTANSASAHQQIMKIEELKWSTSDVKPTRRKRTKSFGSRTDLQASLSPVVPFAGDLAGAGTAREEGYLSEGQTTQVTSSLGRHSHSRALSMDFSSAAPTAILKRGEEGDPPISFADHRHQDSNHPLPKNFVYRMNANDYPFSSLQSSSSSNLSVAEEGVCSPDVDVDLLANESMKESIGLVKKSYLDLQEDLVLNRYLLPLSTSTVRRSVVVPPGKSYEFAVLFTPKLQVKGDGAEDEAQSLQVVRNIKLQLWSAESADTDGKMDPPSNSLHNDLSASLTSYKPIMHAGTPLKPRLLLIKAKLIRSRMKVGQKNINFGNTKVGELSCSSTTVANLSNVPLIYSISKSGSISSSFLSVSNGRKGILDPMSSKSIEFAFKPTLHGPFEETLTIENVLDSSNSQAVIIKAKVFKQELFTIQPLEVKDIVQHATEEEQLKVHTVTNIFETEVMDLVDKRFAELSKYMVEAPPPVYLGNLRLRVPSTVSIKFKICNISSKNRHFMLDCSKALRVFTGNQRVSGDYAMSIQCRVVGREQLQLKNTNGADRNMTEEEKQQLRDKLEKFNQKLKIAVRKQKPEKIEKYQKKIKVAEATLADGRFKVDDDDEDEDGASGPKDVGAEKTKVKAKEVSFLGVDEAEEILKKKSEQDLLKIAGGDEENVISESFCFPLMSEEAAIVIVNVVVHPTETYQQQQNVHTIEDNSRSHVPYTVSGSLRVFESKNEDDIRHVLFGALMDPMSENGDEAFVLDAEEGADLSPRLQEVVAGELEQELDASQSMVPPLRLHGSGRVKDKRTQRQFQRPPHAHAPLSQPPAELPAAGGERRDPFRATATAAGMMSIKVKDTLSFGETKQGTSYVASLQVFNLSAKTSLRCSVVCSNTNLCGHVSVSSLDLATVIPPSGSGYMQVEFQPLKAGKFEQELWLVNTGNEHDIALVVVSAVVLTPQSQLVQFPDLVADVEGKDSKLDLGQIQIPQSSLAAGGGQHQKSEQKYKYPFRIMNVHTNMLFVSAVSNLKRQCFIYADSDCTLPVSNYPLAPGVLSTLYIVIRPSLLAGHPRSGGTASGASKANSAAELFAPPGGVSRGTPREDRPSALGRELVGGIRFVFLNEPEVEGDIGMPLSRMTSQEDIPAALSRNSSGGSISEYSGPTLDSVEKVTKMKSKMFESSVSFKVLIGTSLPRIQMRSVRCRCISVDHQASTSRSLTGAVKGYFDIENMSQAFPYKYSISLANGDSIFAPSLSSEECLHSRMANLPPQCVVFYIMGGHEFVEGEVPVSSKRRITFVVLFNHIYGMLSKFLEVKNVFTGQVEKVNLSLFFDPCKLFARLPRPLKAPQISSSPARQYFWPSVRSKHMAGILSSTNVFATPIDQLVSDVPLWVSMPGGSAGINPIPPFVPPSISLSASDALQDANTSIAATSSSGNESRAGKINDGKSPPLSTPAPSGSNFLPDFGPEGLVDEHMMTVTGPCEEVICSWQLSNPHTSPLRISPASDLPVVVLFESLLSGAAQQDEGGADKVSSQFQQTHASSLKALGNYLKGGNKKAKLSYGRRAIGTHDDLGMFGATGAFSKKNKEQRSMMSVPPELELQGFSVCGEPVTIPPLQAIRVVVRGNSGKQIAHHLRKHRNRWSTLMSGGGLKVVGTIAFISAEQAMKSFFDPVMTSRAQPASSTSISAPSRVRRKSSGGHDNADIFANSQSDLYPIVGYTSVITSFFIPMIKALRTKFHFGVIQSYKRHNFEMKFENVCDRDVSIRIENIHPWMKVIECAADSDIDSSTSRARGLSADYIPQHLGAGDKDVVHQQKSKIGSPHSLLRVLPARRVLSVKMCVTVPCRMTEKKFDQTLRVRNLSLSASGLGNAVRTTIPIHVAFDINYNTGLTFQNKESSSLLYSDKLRSHFVKMDKFYVPSRFHDSKANNAKTVFVKNTTLECIRVFYGTKESGAIEGLARLMLTRKESGAMSEDFSQSPIAHVRSPSCSGEDFKVLDFPPPAEVSGSRGKNKGLPFFELMPGESAEFEVSILAEHGGRVSAERLDDLHSSPDLFFENEPNDQDSGNVESEDDGEYSDDCESLGSSAGEEDKEGQMIGPLLLGRAFFKFLVISMSENAWQHESLGPVQLFGNNGKDDCNDEGESDGEGNRGYESDHDALHEHLEFSVVGCFLPSPTIRLLSEGGDIVTNFSFEASQDDVFSIPAAQSNGAMSINNSHKTAITVHNRIRHFTIHNTTGEDLPYRLTCTLEGKGNDGSLCGSLGSDNNSVNEALYSSSNSTYDIGYQQQGGDGSSSDFSSLPMRDARHDLLPSVHPERGVLAPGEKTLCSVTFEVDSLLLETAHHPSFGTENYKTLFANINAFDDSCPSHPPLVIPAFLSVLEDSKLSPGKIIRDETASAIESGISRGHLHRAISNTTFPLSEGPTSDSVDLKPGIGEDKSKGGKKAGLHCSNHSDSLLSLTPPSLKLRGVTPCAPSSGQYEINLGQEVQQHDQSKWVVSLLNTSSSTQLRYSIATLYPEVDSKWVSFSQAEGVIPPDGTASLALHFVRANVGVFLTYLIIENSSNPQDIVMVRISLQIVQDWRLIPLEQSSEQNLFRIEAPLGWSVMDTYLQQRLRQWNLWPKSSSALGNVPLKPTKACGGSGSSGRGVMDFGSVFIGKVYTRRYFILVNCSDIPLEFQLSSTFPPQVLDFSLSPILPSPLSVVTVEPRNRLCVYMVFTPQMQMLHQEKSGGRGSSSFSPTKEPDRVAPDSPTKLLQAQPQQQGHHHARQRQLEGSVFISCRLVKNHHEAISIRATAMLPAVGVFLKEHFLTLPPSTTAASTAAFMQLGVPEYADVIVGDGEGTLRINTNTSSSTFKDGRWTTASIISIRNIGSGLELPLHASRTVITVYTGMARHGFYVRLLGLDSDGQVDEGLTAERNTQWCKGGGEGGGSTLSIPLLPQEECFLHIAHRPNTNLVDKSGRRHGRADSTDLSNQIHANNSFSILAEDHFMIYNRQKISEKTRIPVRLLLPITPTPTISTTSAAPSAAMVSGTVAAAASLSLPQIPEHGQEVTKDEEEEVTVGDHPPNLAQDLDKKSALNLPLITNVSPTTEIPLSFAGLEGAIASFLKAYSLYWSKVQTRYEGLSRQPVQASSLRLSSLLSPHTQQLNPSPTLNTPSPLGPDLGNNLLITEQEPQLTMAHFFKELRQFLTVTDNSIYQRSVSDHDLLDCSSPHLCLLAREMADLHIHFVAITDMLVLHTMRQSYHGDELMTSAHSAIPVAKLSMLVFSMVFKHPVFLYYCMNNGENQKDEATLFPPPLFPFARTLLYYMSFFPDPPPEMEPLNQLCQTIRRCLQIKI